MNILRRFGLYSETWLSAGKMDRRIFWGAMILHLVFMLWYNSWQSPACDESSYFSYALRWAKGQPERIGILDDSKTPMVFPALWSLSLSSLFPSLESKDGEGLLGLGRIAMYVYFFLLSFGFFCWAYRLFGSRRWMLPWLPFLADPLLISNAMLIGSDMASACFTFWAFYLSWRFFHTQSMRYWWLLAMVCGLGMVIKISLVIMLPMVALLLLPKYISLKNASPVILPRKWVVQWAGLFAICLFLINAAYQFSQTAKPLNTYEAKSHTIKNFQENYPTLSAIPLPLPIHYISSYDLLLRNAATGGGYTNENSYPGVYLNGMYKNIGGFKAYYMVTFFYKTTPLLLLALAGACFMCFTNKSLFLQRLKQWAFVWLPPAVFLLWLSVANPFQIGIRHALPAWPFLYLLAGPFLLYVAERFNGILLIAFILQSGEIAWQLPNLTAYTPIWMQPKKNLNRYMNDSNLSYCNDEVIYRYFLSNHPEYKAPTHEPQAGKFALRLNDCNRYLPEKKAFNCWLLQYFKPKGHYKTTILLFDISEEEIKKLAMK